MALAPWVTFAGTFTVTNLNTTLVVPHSVADQSLSRIIPWKTNTVYPAGALVSINRTPYVSQYSGTSGFGDYGGPVTNITWVTTGANGIAVAITMRF